MRADGRCNLADSRESSIEISNGEQDAVYGSNRGVSIAGKS